MPKPKVAKLNNANRGTYGAGVRFTPGDQTAARSQNQSALKKLVTPTSNPSAAVAGEVNQIMQSQPASYDFFRDGSGVFEPVRFQHGDYNPAYETLKQEASKRGVSVADGLEGQAGLDRLFSDPVLGSRNAAGLALKPLGKKFAGTTADILIAHRPEVSSAENLNTLAHELGHKLAGHVDRSSPAYLLNPGAQEVEAQTIAYGVQNRLYPWLKQPLNFTAQYSLQAQQGLGSIPEHNQPASGVDPSAHLSKPETQARVNQAITDIVPNPRKPFKTITPALYGQPPAPGQPASPPPASDVVSSGLSPRQQSLTLRQQTLSPRDIATNQPRSTAVMGEGGTFQDSFRINQPPKPDNSGFTLSSDSQLNERLRTTGIMGDSKGIGLRGNVPKPVATTAEPASSYDPNAPTTKPTQLTRQVGDRLFSNSERARLNLRGEHVGVGSNPTPVKPSNPMMTKLATLFDFKRKGIYSPEVFQSEVQRAGLQPQLEGVRRIGDVLFNNRGGGEIYSGTMQQSTVLRGLPQDAKLPVSTQVLGEAGIVNDAFRINQPPRPGAPTFAPSRNLEFNIALGKAGGFAGDAGGSGLSRAPGLDSATKAMGYVYKPPSETGLPWAVGADPKTGEMVTLKGKPLPPLVGPSFPTNSATPVPSLAVSSQPKAPSPFKQGFETSVGTAESPRPQSFFKRTPELTEGMSFVDRAKFAAGRLGGDIASDATRAPYWRWNNAFAIAHGVGGKLAGESKVGAALAGTAGVYALGQAGGQFDLTNPGEAFRPKGFSAAFPVDASDKRKIDGGIGGAFGLKELLGRYVIGRSGNLLPYEQFKQERPDVSEDVYNRYSEYLKGGGGSMKPMPANSFDLGGLGLIKGTSQGINGPEVRLGGISINTPAAAASAAAATGVGAIFNKGLRPFVGKALPVVGAGLDFTNRIQEGQKLPQAVAGTAAGVVGGTQGFALGVKLTPGGPIPKFIGGLVGGALGAVGAGAVTDQIAAADAADKKPLQDMLQRQREQPGVWGAINRAVGAVTDFSNDPIGVAKKFFQGGDGKTDTNTTNQAATPVQSVPNKPYSPTGDQGGAGVSPPGKPWETVDNSSYPGTRVKRDGTGVITQATDSQGKDITKEVRQQVEERKNKTLHPEDEQAAGGTKKTGGVVTNTTVEKVARLRYGAGGTPQERVSAAARLATAQARRDKANADPNTAPEEVLAAGSAVKDAQSDVDATMPGQGDRTNESRERIATQGNQTKLANTGLQNEGRLQNTDLTGRYKIANTQEQNKGRLQNTDLTGRYKIANTQEQNKGRLENTDLGGRYKLANTGLQNQGKLQVADLTSGRKLQGQVYTADSKLAGVDMTSGRRLQGQVYTADSKLQGTAYTADQKVNQEGVKQSGAVRVAGLKADSTVSAAGIKADGTVKVAGLKADASVKIADLTTERKAETEGTKQTAAYEMAGMKDGQAMLATDEKVRVARLRQLGVY